MHPKFWFYFNKFKYSFVFNSFQYFIIKHYLKTTYSKAIMCMTCKKLTDKVV